MRFASSFFDNLTHHQPVHSTDSEKNWSPDLARNNFSEGIGQRLGKEQIALMATNPNKLSVIRRCIKIPDMSPPQPELKRGRR